MLYLMLVLPVMTALICLLPLKQKQWENANRVGAVLTGTAALYCFLRAARIEHLYNSHSFLMIDGLSSIFIFTIGVVGMISCLYAVNYLRRDIANGELKASRIGHFYCMLHLFIAAMYLTVLADNLGLMWVAIEGTTIVSALLVGFYGKKSALEAAWKYIIICSVGIAFAMFGIILTGYAAQGLLGAEEFSLSWRFLYPAAAQLNSSLMKLAFIFILIGYGTKAGLFPLHTWLPDAHSQAPSPVSALLSGVLLNCAIYAIIRFHLLTSAAVDSNFSGELLIIFGLVSMLVALPFILVQKDIKRLLAYSSVEHVGIIVLGVGLGGVIGYTGAFLHVINHALGKSVLFLSAGTLAQEYKSKLIPKMRGIGQLLPITSTLFMAALLAIGGAPPFGLFFSELHVASRGFQLYGFGLGFLFFLTISVVFSGLIYFGGKMYFSDLPSRFKGGEVLGFNHLLILLPVCLLIFQGIFMPEALQDLIQDIVNSVISGGSFDV